MLTCSKRYEGIPFAHRAHRDEGPCSKIHGHNWNFEFTFTGTPDERGFVIDFGDLGWIKTFLDATFDHACVFNAADPAKEFLLDEFGSLFKAVVIPCNSCEGIARYTFEAITLRLADHHTTAKLYSVTVEEGAQNKATYFYPLSRPVTIPAPLPRPEVIRHHPTPEV